MILKNTIIKNHPLCRAKWIWPGSYLYLYNHYAHFRKDFELENLPEKAPVYITADHSYRLYVNGHYVCRGPARGYQSHWPFDEVDIKNLLTEGHNWLSIEAYNPGISTYAYIHETCAGFICAAEWNEFRLYSDETWQMRRSLAHKNDTARYSKQLAFQEHLHAKNVNVEWITSPEKPDWPEKLETEFSYTRTFPFGRAPYFSVEERGIPMLRENLYVPEKVISVGRGQCLPGYSDWSNISWKFAKECQLSTWTKSEAPGLKNSGALSFELEKINSDHFSAVTIDTGKYFVGTLIGKFQGCQEDGILDFHFSEAMMDKHPIFPINGDASYIALGNRIFLSNNDFQHEFYHPLGFRYITVVGRNLKRNLTLEVKLRSYEYPFQMKGCFNSSDQILNEIHAACKHTQQICALDAYVDTPWREQTQWWWDARVQAKNTFFLDGDARLLKRGIRSIAAQKTPLGLTYGHAPTSGHSSILPDFSLTWILTIWDYYWQTGDYALMHEQWPRIQEVLAYFERSEVRSDSGLLIHDTRLWYFGDWSNLFKGHVPAFLNLLYLYTLKKLEEILNIANFNKEAVIVAKKIKEHQELIIEKLYNSNEQLIANGLDEQEQIADGYSVHDQVLAIMMNLIPEAKESMFRKIIIPYINMEKQDCAIPSAFWATYPFEVLRENGYGKNVIDFIKAKWKPMLETGTTWEDYEWKPNSKGTCSHAWSAHPSYHFVNIINGIIQTSPAWKSIRIEPVFISELDFAETLIPTSNGDIKSSWKRLDKKVYLTVELPEGTDAEICLPDFRETICGPGKEFITEL